ncbi:hypothetical protein FW320_06695 [Azospirillum sp. Vi22]|uniref:hypothetical protein n=1 Tax=Azospirillum baldaniorum TaxID=1064539 RepID=UPI00157A8B5F|nr:hypothetical protein [Azospirillum baldaniorum]NUB05864.1 hypothetical protein [Azospirillum baldaniorum]
MTTAAANPGRESTLRAEAQATEAQAEQRGKDRAYSVRTVLLTRQLAQSLEHDAVAVNAGARLAEEAGGR